MTTPTRIRVRRDHSDLLSQFPLPASAPYAENPASSGRTGKLAVFMLEQVMPGLTPADIDSVQRAINDATRRVTLEGLPVRCLRTSYVPSQHRWICLFVSRGVDSVRRIAELAQLTYPKISEVMVLASRTPQRLTP